MNATPARVLVVEDDPDILSLLQATLTFNGYRVETARNGYEGLQAIQRDRPQLVVADIMMPKMDGFGMVNRLRLGAETRDIPVVVITATYVAPEDREFAQSIGATRFIQKPIELETFLQTVRDLLQQGAHAGPEPIRDLEFYDGYRRRLEVKLDQRVAQIAREQFLLNTATGEERLSIQASLGRAISDRDELKLLLEQIRQRLKPG